jgi:insulysin
MEIIKSENDKRIMKYFTLKNKLKYVCVQDDDLDKSYIVACVRVGSTGNKKYYDGLAHLLEHMCFITSKKYKEKGYLQNKATEFGGYTNAYTDDLNTVYYFEIFTKNLNEMIEIFSDYLFNSELNQKFILDEMKNVDSEHNKNLNNDNFRIFNIEHLLCDPLSEFNSFFTGSLNSLNKLDIREKLLTFYKKYYVPENISLCIVSNLKINYINDIIKNNFNDKKNNKIFNEITIKKPFYTKNINKSFIINSINKSYQLKYIFETIKLNKYNNSKVFNYISLLLNTNMKNSLNDFLKINNYIIYLESSFEISNGLFIINFELTNKGYKKIKDIDGYLRYYLNFIFKYNFKDLYNIFKTIDEFNFSNIIKEDSMDLAQILATNCFKYDIKDIYRGDYLILEYNEEHIKDLYKFLNFENSLQLIITHKFNEKKFSVDPNYGTKYKQIKKIISLPKEFHIELNLYNSYIDKKLVFYNNLNTEIPIEITKNNWFGNTSKFNEKINYVSIIFSKSDFFNSPKNLIYTNISLIVLDFLLRRELYDAININYNFHFSIIQNKNEIILNLNLINDKKNSQRFIDFILDFIITGKNNININNEFILQKIENFKLQIKNIKNISPWDYVNYIENLNYENFYSYDLIIKELNIISIKEFMLYYNNLFSNSKCITYTFGNIDVNYNFNKITNYLNKKFSYNKINLPKIINVIHPNNKEQNNCVKILIKVGKYNKITILHIYLVNLIIKDIYYNKLRTDKQLGYLVSFYWTKINNIYYFVEKIQSSFDLELVSKYIFEFNKNILSYIEDINFDVWIDNLKLQLISKENNIHELFKKYYVEILNREFNFKRNIELLAKINKVTKKSLFEFINKFIVKNKNIHIINIHSKKSKLV